MRGKRKGRRVLIPAASVAFSTWCVTYVRSSPSRWGGRLVVAAKPGFTANTAAWAAALLQYIAVIATEP